jgi:hypothetical protein
LNTINENIKERKQIEEKLYTQMNELIEQEGKKDAEIENKLEMVI